MLFTTIVVCSFFSLCMYFGGQYCKQYESRSDFSLTCENPEFCQRGPTLTTFLFSVDERREDPHTNESGPSSARQRNADDGPILNAGFW